MRSCSILLLCVYAIGSLTAQPSGSQYVKSGMLAGNNVYAVIGNWGVIGQPMTQGSRGAWMNPNNGYIGDLSFMIGVEIPGTAAHSVATCPVTRPTAMADWDPKTGQAWTFQPRDGYCSALAGRVAVSTDQASWPTVWPDHPEWKDQYPGPVWNGLFGPGKPGLETESFYVVDDNNDLRFSLSANNPRSLVFHPDSVHPERGGLGLRVAVRHLQSSAPLLQDVLFLVYDIVNEGTTNYSKVVFGQLMGTYVGVTATENYFEYSDDVTAFFKADNVVITSDFNNTTANPNWVGPIGRMGHAFVEAPNHNRIASYVCLAPGQQFRMGDDEALWGQLTPNTVQSVFPDSLTASFGADADYTMGSEYFSLAAGESRRIVLVLAYGYTNDEIRHKVQVARAAWREGLALDKLGSRLSLAGFPASQTLTGMQQIRWTSAFTGGSLAVWYSPDAGHAWSLVHAGLPNTGSYAWNTASVSDAAFGRIRLILSDSLQQLVGVSESETMFRVANSPAGPPPGVIIRNAEVTVNTSSSTSAAHLSLLVGGGEGASMAVTFQYAIGTTGRWLPIDVRMLPASFAEQPVTLNTTTLPNAPAVRFRVLVSDGTRSAADSTRSFVLATPRSIVPQGQVHHAAGQSTVPYELHVVDKARLTGDSYVITFDDTTSPTDKRISIYNRTRSTYALRNQPLVPSIESPIVDGLAFQAADITTAVPSYGAWVWNRTMPPELSMFASRASFQVPAPSSWRVYEGYNSPSDYRFVFFDAVVDSSLDIPELLATPLPLRFTVTNISTNKRVRVMAGIADSTLIDVVLMEGGPGALGMTWEVMIAHQQGGLLPMRGGDTLVVTTVKGLSYRDSITFAGITTGVAGGDQLPGEPVLMQNYPNPFNPITTVQYLLPTAADVEITVFDILGRTAAVLEHGHQAAGVHAVAFDAGRLASGVYFCRMRSGVFEQTRKMLVVR